MEVSTLGKLAYPRPIRRLPDSSCGKPAATRHTCAALQPTQHVANPRSAAAIVRPATRNDLGYVVDLQRREHRSIGFCPRAALEAKINLQRLWLTTDNGQPAGFLHHGSLAKPEARIFQAAVQYDARRQHLGLQLIADFESRAAAVGAKAISLRCLNSLDANTFWQTAGFAPFGTEPGGRSRGATLNVWVKKLADGPLEFHSRVHPCPRCGRPTTDTWTAGAKRWAHCPPCVNDLLNLPL